MRSNLAMCDWLNQRPFIMIPTVETYTCVDVKLTIDVNSEVYERM